MTQLRAALAGILALVTATAAFAQTFPSVPDRTVIGRVGTGSGSGPSQAVPFATLGAQLSSYFSVLPPGRTLTTSGTIATSDCGTTILAGTGSSGLFTLTLPSATGFASTCRIVIKNGDTGRGKALSGFPADLYPLLWPSQTVVVGIVSGAWATFVNPGKWLPTGTPTLNVDHASGSDAATNDCLGTGAGACATVFHAFQVHQTQIKASTGISPVIQTDCGFTDSPSPLLGALASGTGILVIKGNEASPSSCVWTSAGIVVNDGLVISLRGFTARTTGGGRNFLTVGKFGLAVWGNMIWGAASGGANIAVSQGGQVVWDDGTYQVGEAACAPTCFNTHISNQGGFVYHTNSSPAVSVPSALTFNNFYQGLGASATSAFNNLTFTGSGAGSGSTGTKYNISSGTLYLLGTTLPGATAGVSSLGACIDATSCAPVDYNQLTNVGHATYKLTGVNFNSANTDNSITLTAPTGYSRYQLSTVMISHCSATATTATFGIFTAAAGGGTAIVASGTAVTVSTASENSANNAQFPSIAVGGWGSTRTQNVTPLFFRVQTPQGSAVTCDVTLQANWMS